MIVLLLSILVAFFGFLTIHPFLTYPLSLFTVNALCRWREFELPLVAESNTSLPSISICFCAFNEQSVIGAKIDNLERVADSYPGPVEILVYTDACTDETAAIARARGRNHTQIIESHQRSGKSIGMNCLVRRATGDLIVFTDADVMFCENTLAMLATPFQDPEIGCVCGNLVFNNPKEGDIASVGSAFARLKDFLKAMESSSGSTMGADGGLFAIRRSLFREIPRDIIDDMFTSFSILCDGYRVVWNSEAIGTNRLSTESADEFRRKTRIGCRSFNCHRFLFRRLCKMSPWNLYKYLSHKLLRWFAGFHLILTFIFAGLLATQMGFWFPFSAAAVLLVLAIFIGAKIPIARRGSEAILELTGVSIGILKSLRGQKYETWVPPASTRSEASEGSA